ncbi:Uncharacterised protein [Mycobacteroides abscessus]|nr:Uncharacterised protein [Mycobacteroides abscessus]
MASNASRAVTVMLVIALPSTMAAIGTTATPVSGTTPGISSSGSTAAHPTASAPAAHAAPRLARMRLAAVTPATTNMPTRTSADDHNRAIAATSTPATAANCSAPRIDTHGTVHGEPIAATR